MNYDYSCQLLNTPPEFHSPKNHRDSGSLHCVVKRELNTHRLLCCQLSNDSIQKWHTGSALRDLRQLVQCWIVRANPSPVHVITQDSKWLYYSTLLCCVLLFESHSRIPFTVIPYAVFLCDVAQRKAHHIITLIFTQSFGLRASCDAQPHTSEKNSHFTRQRFWIVTFLTAISRYFIYLFIGLHTLNWVTRGNAMHSWLLMLTRLPEPSYPHINLCCLNHIFTLLQSHFYLCHIFTPQHWDK